jgi:adenylate kinase family enzyme
MQNADQKIIHICGPPGSGKTTLGRRIEKRFGDTIFVKDVDDLRSDFIKTFYGESKWSTIDKDAYQRYIDKFIKKRNKKPIVFVGLTTMPWWHKNHYYDLHATHRFYIDIDDDTILKRKYLRLLQGMLNDKRAIDDLLHQNEQFIKRFTTLIKKDLDSTRCAEQNEEFKKSYLDMGYVVKSQSGIYDEVKRQLRA